jgi:hypothetical protein
VSVMRSTLGCFAFIVAGAGSTLAAQDGAADSAPTFDQLARRVLTSKVQVEALRARLDGRASSAADGSPGGWRPIAWADSLGAMRIGFDSLAADSRRLQRMYRKASHDQGLKVATDLVALVEGSREAFEALVRAANARSARAEITHVAAGLDALLQTIAEGEACCKKALR